MNSSHIEAVPVGRTLRLVFYALVAAATLIVWRLASGPDPVRNYPAYPPMGVQVAARGTGSTQEMVTPQASSAVSGAWQPGEVIGREGFKFVLSGPTADLEVVTSVSVLFPDKATAMELTPVGDGSASPHFEGAYNLAGGLPPLGDYVFRITTRDGARVDVPHHFGGTAVLRPEGLSAEINREAGSMTIMWQPVPGVTYYTVRVQNIQPNGAYFFVEDVGCPNPSKSNPADPDTRFRTKPFCTLDGLKWRLVGGETYGIQIAAWGDESTGYAAYGAMDGALIFVW